ncbi:MAG TPA: alanine racemase C-terminal domain-containing protein [Candidatus Babeliaceae bacterium]|nr:alanine racemase C-terminal domain-containing protein [Candidatus Babeliaceae bacterium]
MLDRSWVEISRFAFTSIINNLLKAANQDCITLDITANAYGHGFLQIALLAEQESAVSMIYLNTLEEAFKLRQAGVKKPILIEQSTGQLPTIFQFKPFLSWKTRIYMIKQIPAQTSVGYNQTHLTTRTTTLAILPVGYTDGYPRALSNNAYVYVHGKVAPVIGLVSMNLLTVDITEIRQTQVGDEVTLLGPELLISYETLSSQANMIPLELTARINSTFDRIIAP